MRNDFTEKTLYIWMGKRLWLLKRNLGHCITVKARFCHMVEKNGEKMDVTTWSTRPRHLGLKDNIAAVRTGKYGKKLTLTDDDLHSFRNRYALNWNQIWVLRQVLWYFYSSYYVEHKRIADLFHYFWWQSLQAKQNLKAKHFMQSQM